MRGSRPSYFLRDSPMGGRAGPLLRRDSRPGIRQEARSGALLPLRPARSPAGLPVNGHTTISITFLTHLSERSGPMSKLFRRKSVADARAISPRRRAQGTLNQVASHALGVGRRSARASSRLPHRIVGDAQVPARGPAIGSRLSHGGGLRFCGALLRHSPRWLPISGSPTPTPIPLGEFVAWIIGWDLIIEYAVGNSRGDRMGGYSASWSVTSASEIPLAATDPRTASMAAAAVAAGATDATSCLASAVSNAPHISSHSDHRQSASLPAVAVITVVLVIGIKESANTNNALVLLRSASSCSSSPSDVFLLRPSTGRTRLRGFAPNGFQGNQCRRGVIFFSYIGFDAVSTESEEAKNPVRICRSASWRPVICRCCTSRLAGDDWNRALNTLGTPER